MHLTSSPLDWYAARAAGIVAYLLLSAVVALGIALAGRLPGKRWRRWPMFAVEDVHRAGGLLVGTFIAIHVGTIAIDSFLPFSPLQILVPLTSAYRPVWVALGVVAAELLAALAITNHYRRRLPHRFWRRAHYINFAVWLAATLHGMGSGSDRSAPWMVAIYAVCVASVAAAISWRLGAGGHLWSPLRPVGVASVGLLTGLAAASLVLGPLRAHVRPWNARSFRDTLTGQILQESAVTRAIVSMSGEAKGPQQNVLVRADLLVAPRKLQSTRFQMEFLPSGTVCTGRVTAVHPTGFSASCRIGPGDGRRVTAAWTLVSPARLRGTLAVSATG